MSINTYSLKIFLFHMLLLNWCLFILINQVSVLVFELSNVSLTVFHFRYLTLKLRDKELLMLTDSFKSSGLLVRLILIRVTTGILRSGQTSVTLMCIIWLTSFNSVPTLILVLSGSLIGTLRIWWFRLLSIVVFLVEIVSFILNTSGVRIVVRFSFVWFVLKNENKMVSQLLRNITYS